MPDRKSRNIRHGEELVRELRTDNFRRTELQVKNPPRRRGTLPGGQVPGADQKRKPPSKTKPPSFDVLVARYYCVIYDLALGMTDDPLEAVLLTHDAFNRTRKQLRNRCEETVIMRMLIAAVIEALNARHLN